jgi:bifunctional polynucleotide phosphatase/kinase
MAFKWQVENNFIFGKSNYIEKLEKSTKQIYLFDLDYTLIKTKSGKKFPIDKDDWVELYPDIPEKIKQLDNCLIGIISNQKGLKTQTQIDDWIYKLESIAKIIKIDFVFGSICDDRYRKPLPGSIEFIKEQIINVDWECVLAKNKIYYIGDAFGRKDDFSDTDIKFATNCEFKFKKYRKYEER